LKWFASNNSKNFGIFCNFVNLRILSSLGHLSSKNWIWKCCRIVLDINLTVSKWKFTYQLPSWYALYLTYFSVRSKKNLLNLFKHESAMFFWPVEGGFLPNFTSSKKWRCYSQLGKVKLCSNFLFCILENFQNDNLDPCNYFFFASTTQFVSFVSSGKHFVLPNKKNFGVTVNSRTTQNEKEKN